MTRSTLKSLLIVVALLVGLLAIVELNDDGGDSTRDRVLLPALKPAINEIESITIVRGEEAPLRLDASGGTWVVSDRGGYPADVGRIRELLLALADARILEEKTANPERYAQLGVEGPAAGSDSARLTIAAGERRFDIIIGDVAQRSFRYVRLADDATSLLIDTNPALPDMAGDWLQPDILDIDSERIRALRIVHADGEEILATNTSADAPDFEVSNLPEGRELSYPTVVNGLAAALAGLTLEEVRRAEPGDAAVTARYETFDGLVITASIVAQEETTWIGFTATAAAREAAEPDARDEPNDGASAEAEPAADPRQEAEAVNARLAGWQFRVPDYKVNLMQRRWEDILKAET
jgi:hypothetical protein